MAVEITRTSISDREHKLLKDELKREIRTGVIGVFIFFTLPSLAAVIFFFELPFVQTMGIACLIGAACAGAVAYQHRKWTRSVRADLAVGEYEELHVSAFRAFEVIPNGSWSMIAIDCGPEAIICAGNWWTATQGKRHVKWSGRGIARFPSTEFTLKRLPKSGRVIGVHVSGERIEIEYFEPGEASAFLTVEHAGYTDCQVHLTNVEEIIEWKPAADSGREESEKGDATH
ncbi:MAG: hypothetical protein RIK87_04085 [Fuerstiella sp.]